MQALEGTEHHLCLPRLPIEDFDEYMQFRQAHGRGTGERDRDAFVHLLSTIRLSCEKGQCFDRMEGEDNKERRGDSH